MGESKRHSEELKVKHGETREIYFSETHHPPFALLLALPRFPAALSRAPLPRSLLSCLSRLVPARAVRLPRHPAIDPTAHAKEVAIVPRKHDNRMTSYHPSTACLPLN